MRAAHVKSTLNALVSLGLLASITAFFLVVLGGRIFTLGADEVFFLTEAYALKEGWSATISYPSLPYDLYLKWLGLPLTPGVPERLWRSIWMDTFAQLGSIALLIGLTVRLQERRQILSTLTIICGVLFFFSIGRLAEHRPDYLSITSLFIAAVLVLLSWLASTQRRWRLLSGMSGVFFAFAVCFSPRALVVIAFSAPMLATLGWRFAGFRRMSAIGGLAVLGFVSCLTLLAVFEIFDVVSSFQTLIRSEHGPTGGMSLRQRLFEGVRPPLVLITLLSLICALGLRTLTTEPRAKLWASAAASFAAGQLFLIVFDARIYEYGYSFGLVAFLLLHLALSTNHQHSKPPIPYWSTFLTAFLFSLVFLVQIPPIKDSKNYFYKRTLTLAPGSDESASDQQLFKQLNVGNSLLIGINARLILCRRFQGYYVVSHWAHSPICLQNGGQKVLQTEGQIQFEKVRNRYPSRAELNALLTAEGLSTDARGMLFAEDPDGGDRRTVEINR